MAWCFLYIDGFMNLSVCYDFILLSSGCDLAGGPPFFQWLLYIISHTDSLPRPPHYLCAQYIQCGWQAESGKPAGHWLPPQPISSICAQSEITLLLSDWHRSPNRFIRDLLVA